MSITDAQISGLQENIGTYIDSRLGNFVGVQPPEYKKTIPGQCTERSIRGTYPTVSGIETGQYFLNLVAERHCSSGFEWFKSCGPGLSGYEPSITTPFELTGYPTNDKGFWERYKQNIIGLGQVIANDFSYRPWNSHGSSVGWSGTSYSPEYDYPISGQHPIPSGMFKYGKLFSDDFHTFVPKGNQKYPQFYNLFQYTNIRTARVYTGLTETLSDNQVDILESSGEEIGLAIRPYISGYGVVSGEWVPIQDLGASVTVALTGDGGIYDAPEGLNDQRSGPRYIVGGACFTIPASGQVVTSQPNYQPHDFYSGVPNSVPPNNPRGGGWKFDGGYDDLPFPPETSITDGPLVWKGVHYQDYEAEFYRSDATLNLWPVYQYIYGWGDASFSGDHPLNQATESEGLISYSPFSSTPVSMSDPQGAGAFAVVVSGDEVLQSYNCDLATSGLEKRNTLYTRVWGGNSKRCIFFPLEGPGGLRSSFKGITGIQTSGNNYIKLEDGNITPDYFLGLSEYTDTWLGNRSFKIPDYIANNIFDCHGEKFFSASGAIEYAQSGTYNNLASYDLGELGFYSGLLPEDRIAKRREDWSFTPSGYPVNIDGVYNLDVRLFGCDKSGEQFIGVFFDFDMDSKSGEIYEKTNNITISTTSYIRARTRYRGTTVFPTYEIRPVFFNPQYRYCKFENPTSYTSPWSDWQYEGLGPLVSGTSFGGLHRPGHSLPDAWYMAGMGQQTRATPPVVARRTVTLTIPSSGVPHTHMGVGGSVLELEPPEMLYESGDSRYYFSL